MTVTTAPKLTVKDRIAEALKNLGYTSKHVSVSKKRSTYDDVFKLTIRDASVVYSKVENIRQRFEHIDRDERTYEILAGGNDYVRIEISTEVCDAWAKDYQEKVEKAMADCTESHGSTIDGTYSIHLD